MTPNSIEELAREILKPYVMVASLPTEPFKLGNLTDDSRLVQDLAKALLSHGESMRREGHEQACKEVMDGTKKLQVSPSFKMLFEQARREGMEEAAKVAEGVKPEPFYEYDDFNDKGYLKAITTTIRTRLTQSRGGE